MSIIAIPPGAGWVDDFDGVALNAANWWRDTHWDHDPGTPGGMSAYGMFADDAALYEVADSVLTLRSQYQSGTEWHQPIISTRGLQEETLGIWRAAMRWDRGHAITGGFWLIDPADTAHEVDICEVFPGQAPTPYMYYNNLNLHGWCPTTRRYCPADNDTVFHVYEAEITEREVIYRRDYVETTRHPVAPQGSMLAILSMNIGVWWEPEVPDETTPRNPAMSFDWVGWWPNPVRAAGPYATGLDF